MIYIEQPAFLPWLGFCESLFACETVALLDDVQFRSRGWQNRNRIKTANGIAWLTIPVERDRNAQLRDIRISDEYDSARMLEAIRHGYSSCRYYSEVMEVLAPLLSKPGRWLSDLNIQTIEAIARALGAQTTFVVTSEMETSNDGPVARIAEICKALDEEILWAGDGTRGYLPDAVAEAYGLRVRWNEYTLRHPRYNQRWMTQGFVPGLSVVDAACNVGWIGLAAMLRHSSDSHLSNLAAAGC